MLTDRRSRAASHAAQLLPSRLEPVLGDEESSRGWRFPNGIEVHAVAWPSGLLKYVAVWTYLPSHAFGTTGHSQESAWDLLIQTADPAMDGSARSAVVARVPTELARETTQYGQFISNGVEYDLFADGGEGYTDVLHFRASKSS